MAMSVRERTTEIAVMRTLGFPSATIFVLVAGEGLLMSIVGGVVGAVLAQVDRQRRATSASGGFIPDVRRQRRKRRDRRRRSARCIGVLAGMHSRDDGLAAQDRRRAAAGGLA